MPTEYEARILDIDPAATTNLILARGGQHLGEALMRRYVYDIKPDDPSRWIRLRDTGTAVTLTVKEIAHDGIDGTHETEILVDDFDTTNALLGRLGFTPKSYQETHRVSFSLNQARLEIDTWPHIPPYLEIEADTRQHVIDTAALLGYGEHQLTSQNTIKIYAQYGIDLNTTPELRFALETEDT